MFCKRMLLVSQHKAAIGTPSALNWKGERQVGRVCANGSITYFAFGDNILNLNMLVTNNKQ